MVDRIDWDGKEFLCTGVSVKIDNEKGIVLAEIEGEASTWGPDGVAGPYPLGKPLPNPPSNNPPEYWPKWPPPVGLPPDGEGGGNPPPWAENLDFPITAYMGLASGHVIRGTDLGVGWGDICEYHNCGQVDANGIYWMALDEFDPVNTAMVCSYNKIYKTTNLSTDAPDWDLVLTISTEPATEIDMVRSSPVQRDLWMAIGYGGTSIVVWWSMTGGEVGTWNTTNFTSGDADGAWQVFLEMSSHDANRAWAMWVDVINERTYVATTNDMWTTAPTQTYIPTSCFNDNSVPRPCCHHREHDNDDDSERLYGGVHVKTATDYARVYKSPDCATLYTDPGNTGWVWVHMVGCGVGTSNRWWAIASDDTIRGFWVSDDAINWTEQQNWALQSPRLFSRDCKNLRGNWQWYIMTRDGTVYPVTITIDRGLLWAPQYGNWLQLITDEGLGNPDVMVVCPVEAARA